MSPITTLTTAAVAGLLFAGGAVAGNAVVANHCSFEVFTDSAGTVAAGGSGSVGFGSGGTLKVSQDSGLGSYAQLEWSAAGGTVNWDASIVNGAPNGQGISVTPSAADGGSCKAISSGPEPHGSSGGPYACPDSVNLVLTVCA